MKHLFSVEDTMIIIEEDGKGFHAYSPLLPGLHTCGSTLQETIANARDAVIAYRESQLKHLGEE